MIPATNPAHRFGPETRLGQSFAPLELAEARRIASHIASELQPFCERLEIAGSIRRGRPSVNDIDLVILPKPGQREALAARVLRDPRTSVIQHGAENLLVRLANGVQLDIFLARPRTKDLFRETPGNFGSLLLCRTGSRRHNIHLIETAKRIADPFGGHLGWNPYFGVHDSRGNLIASETEEDIFHALHLDFVEPQNRE